METDASSDDLVTLQIEDKSLQCSRSLLTSNSDYFKAMLDGSFAESTARTITLKGTSYETMQAILLWLWDNSTTLPSGPNLLHMLQAASMFLFTELQAVLIDKVIGGVDLENCLTMWFFGQKLTIPKIYRPAKLLALQNLCCVVNTAAFLGLAPDELCLYLGEFNLYTRDCGEIAVFRALIKWFSHNHGQSDDCTKVDALSKLLHCVDFHDLTVDNMSEIVQSEGLPSRIVDILNLVGAALSKTGSVEEAGDNVVMATARSLLQSRRRNKVGYLSILVKMDSIELEEERKKKRQAVIADRKRKLFNARDSFGFSIIVTEGPYLGGTFSLYSLDYDSLKFTKIEDIPDRSDDFFERKTVCVGHRVVGEKHSLYLFGGEFVMGSGEWNSNFVAYDLIRSDWVKHDRIPFSRRHFKTCLVGDYLFVIGGTGSYRVIHEDMFWYNLKEGKWSELLHLPPTLARELISCAYKDDQLFLLNISDGCGYLFKPSDPNSSLVKYLVEDVKGLPAFRKELALFCYKDKLYLRDNSELITIDFEQKGEDTIIHVAAVRKLTVSGDECVETFDLLHTETILRGNIFYTVGKYKSKVKTEDGYLKSKIAIEALNMDTFEARMATCWADCYIDENFTIDISNIFHPDLVRRSELINDQLLSL